jgi:3-hydroxyisobutyryl-CoA hydrolase
VIDHTIEEFSSERQPDEASTPFIGETRNALDFAFRHDRVEEIFKDLESFVNHNDAAISQWAANTIATLNLRSPTSLKVALKAIRKGKKMTLLEALDMELKIATAYCVSQICLYVIYMFVSCRTE